MGAFMWQRVKDAPRGVPRPVLATAFATFVAFMGIGVVDPLLPLIGKQMGATPFQVEWLFTSYISVMALTMLVSGFLATRLGSKRTLSLGLGLVVIFATASGLAPNIPVFAVIRGGWGLGNALFTSTALSIIVGVSSGGVVRAITLYEAALGLGIASGPLLGGALGAYSWRYPFFATATLMALGLITTVLSVQEPPNKETRRTLKQVVGALRNNRVATNALVALTYSYAFFTVLAYSPLTLKGLTTIQLGFTYFLWGVLVAVSSVFFAPRVAQRLTPVSTLRAALITLILIFLGLSATGGETLLALVVLTGFPCGVANALFTTLAIRVSPYTRSISSASYNLLRWSGAAIAPILSGLIGQTYGYNKPFIVAAGILVFGVIYISIRAKLLLTALSEKNGEGESEHE
ncbi:MAG: MFS transporter [Thermoprotei archaeon]